MCCLCVWVYLWTNFMRWNWVLRIVLHLFCFVLYLCLCMCASVESHHLKLKLLLKYYYTRTKPNDVLLFIFATIEFFRIYQIWSVIFHWYFTQLFEIANWSKVKLFSWNSNESHTIYLYDHANYWNRYFFSRKLHLEMNH